MTEPAGTALYAVPEALEAQLYGVAPTDARWYVAVAVAIIVVSVVACWVPARRAMRADPLQALRSD